jgi:hypothetical protein
MVIIGRVTAHAKRAKPIVKNVLAQQLVLLVSMAIFWTAPTHALLAPLLV